MTLSEALDQIAENIADEHPDDGIIVVRELNNTIGALRNNPTIDSEYQIDVSQPNVIRKV